MSWRVLGHRFSFILFMALSAGLLVIGHAQPDVIEQVRVKTVDLVSPVLDVMAQPLDAMEDLAARLQSYHAVLAENEKLRADNASLVRWQNKALSLAAENTELKSLLNYKNEPAAAYISARVIADTGGAYARSLIVTAGTVDGVRAGMAAMAGDGLIGRVIEVGDWSSRILMITDINSRIPVVVTPVGDQAILGGDNKPNPKLLYLPQDSNVREGMRVMTSGHGGVFPPHVPVGVVATSRQGQFEVVPFASLGRISQVKLIDFSLAGGVANKLARTLPAR